MFIQQSVKHDKDKYVKGTYVVSSKDPEYLKELDKTDKILLEDSGLHEQNNYYRR